MLTLGGKLKIKELLSARLGDVLSSMYLASTVLKHFENQGRRATDLPLVEWSVRTLMYRAQEQLHSFLRNFPNRPVAFLLRLVIFPRGRTYHAPADELGGKIVDLITRTGEARERLSQQAYTTLEATNPLGLLQEALALSEKLAPLENKLKQAKKEGLIQSEYFGHQIDEAESAEINSAAETRELRAFHEKVLHLLSVDDFSPEELSRTGSLSASPAVPVADAAAIPRVQKSKPKTKKAVAKKRAAAKKSSRKKVASKKKTVKKK
jgi:acyl-CoA dehydrogenase